jgi:hypothetical protein
VPGSTSFIPELIRNPKAAKRSFSYHKLTVPERDKRDFLPAGTAKVEEKIFV